MPGHNTATVQSTTKTLVNTVGKVREILNTLLHYNPATMPLTDTQIRWLLHSSFDSIIKNILFFELVYGAVLELENRELFYKLLKKVGLKELSHRYHEWLHKRKAAQSIPQPLPELVPSFEGYRPTPTAPSYTQEQLKQLNVRLADLYKAFALVKDELRCLFQKHQALVQNLLSLNAHHVETVSSLAQDTGIQLTPQQVIMTIPDAQTAYHKALSPQAQIQALGLLINEGVSAKNHIILVKQFLLSSALRTARTAYEDGLGMLNIEFSMVTEAIVACQMRQSELVGQITEVEAIISSAHAKAGAAPKSEPIKPINVDDLHDMLSNWSPYN